jgi:CDP-diacylglycerol---glycerol-3-phosphate 3-phosphatidyltransferase
MDVHACFCLAWPESGSSMVITYDDARQSGRREQGKPVNLPNKLTLARMVIIPFFVAFLFVDLITDNLVTIASFRLAAFVLFIVAAITDYYDGVIARSRNLITSFGQLMDPLADKLLTMAALVAFVELRIPPPRPIFPAWAIIVILGREFLVTGLRSIAMRQGRVIAADKWGKHKTIWQLTAIITILFFICVRDGLLIYGIDTKMLDAFLPWLHRLLLTIVLILTVYSGFAYMRTNWDVITDRE